jgi:gliding motility-associated-like protein
LDIDLFMLGMNPKKYTYKIAAIVLLFFAFCQVGKAQCTFDLDIVNVRASYCNNNGIISVSMTGNNIAPVHIELLLDNSVVARSTSANQQFAALRAGVYTVRAYSCQGTSDEEVKEMTVTVENEEEPLDVFRVENPFRHNSMRCLPTGMVSINIAKGVPRPSYTIEITSAPAGYAGERVFKTDSAGVIDIGNLPAGIYSFDVSDVCFGIPIRNVEIRNISSDFPTLPYGSSITTGNNCREAFACVDVIQNWDLLHYWVENRSEYYEVAFSFDGNAPAADAWMSPDDCSRLYLPDLYKGMHENNMKVRAYLRIKGTDCMIMEELSFAPPENELRFEEYDRNCTDYAYIFDVSTPLCPPFRWELRNLGGTLVQSGNGTDNQRIENLEYDRTYRLTLLDSVNNIIEINGSPTISISSPLPRIEEIYVWRDCGEFVDWEFIMNPLICRPVTWQVFESGTLIKSSPAPVHTNSVRIGGLEYDKHYLFRITDQMGVRYSGTHIHERQDTVTISETKRCTYYNMSFQHRNACLFDLVMKHGDMIVGSAKNVQEVTVEKLQYDTIYSIFVTDPVTGTILLEVDTMIKISADFSIFQEIKVGEYKCEEYTLSIVNSIECASLKWSVTIRYEADNSLFFSGEYEDMPGLQYGVGYIVTVIDEIGRETSVIFNVSYTAEFTGEAAYVPCLTANDSIDGHIYIAGDLYSGVRIRFLSGPKIPVHTEVILDMDTMINFFYPFSQNYLIAEDVVMEKGEYAFEVEDRCKKMTDTIRVYFESKRYEIRNFGFYLDEETDVCNGTGGTTRLYPLGRIYWDGILIENDSTRYTVIESPGGRTNGYTVAPSGYIPMSETGRYVFQIHHRDVCSFDTVGVHFQQRPVAPEGTSGYMCSETDGTAYIFIQAKGGLPPYTYTLDKTNEENDTGFFEVITSIGETYNITVKDACGRRTPFPVQIIALDQMTVIGGRFDVCRGGDLNLTGLLMGAIEYEWRKEPDATIIATTQNLHIPNVTFDDAGDYTVRITPFGCNRIVEEISTVTVYELPPPSVDDTIFICRLGTPHRLWIKPEEGYEIQWRNPLNNSVSSSPEITIHGDEEYDFYLSLVERWQGSIICRSGEKKVTVKRNTKQAVFLSAHVKNVCTPEEGNAGAIDLVVSGGSEPYQYLWSTGATTQNLVDIPVGDYSVEVEDAYGCSNAASYSVTNQSPIILTLRVEQAYDCASTIGTQTTILTNISGGTTPYKLPEWIIDGVTATLGDTLITSSYNETVTLRVTDDRRCVKDTTFVTSIPAYGIYSSVIDCNDHVYGFDAVVHGASGSTYLWEFGDGQTSTIRNPRMQFEQPGEYEVSLTVNNIGGNSCTYELKNFEVYPIPDVIAGDVQFCIGEPVEVIVTGSADYYIWRHGNRVDTTDVYVIETTGRYTIRGMTENGCWKSIAIEASHYPYYQYQIYTDRREVTPEDPAIQIRTDEVPGSFLTWDFGDGYTIDNRNDLTYIYDVSRDTRYRLALSAINPHGCLETASVFIHVNRIPLANTFTPNGDGIHDIFLRGWRIEVFNRNGVLLYEGTEGWDGTYKGVPVGSDTYFYCLYDDTEEGVKRYVNYVTIVR